MQFLFIFVSFCYTNQTIKKITSQQPNFPHQFWIQKGFPESTSSASLMQPWAGPLEPYDPHHGPVFVIHSIEVNKTLTVDHEHSKEKIR